MHVRQHQTKDNLSCDLSGCPNPGVVFLGGHALNRHVRTAHLHLSPPTSCVKEAFPCTAVGCGMNFTTKEELKRHEDERPRYDHTGRLQCTMDGCSWSTKISSRSLWIAHYRQVHNIYTIKPKEAYQCKFPGCGDWYTVKANLKRHRGRHRLPRQSMASAICHHIL